MLNESLMSHSLPLRQWHFNSLADCFQRKSRRKLLMETFVSSNIEDFDRANGQVRLSGGGEARQIAKQVIERLSVQLP